GSGLSSRLQARVPLSLQVTSPGGAGIDQFGQWFSFVEAPPTPPGKVGELLLGPGGPRHRDTPYTVGGAQADQQPPVAGRQVAPAAVDKAHLPQAVALDLHARADGVAIALLTVAAESRACQVVRRAGRVGQQGGGTAVVAEGQVGLAVVVVVRRGQSAADTPGAEVTAGNGRDVAETPRPQAQKKLRL